MGRCISDLYRMTKRSIIDGAVEYMPRKTVNTLTGEKSGEMLVSVRLQEEAGE